MLPGALVRSGKLAEFKGTEVHRKVYLIGNNVAVACAGIVKHIENFLEESTALVLSAPDHTLLTEVFESLRTYEEHLEALVCYEDGRKHGLIAPTGSQSSNQPFFNFNTIGSGAEDLAQMVQHDFVRWDKSRWETIKPYDAIANVAGRVGSRMIGNELLFGYGKDWGGFGEWATFNHRTQRWSYALPSLHGFVLGVPVPGKRFTLEQSRYWYCYNNDEALGSSAVLGLRLFDQAYLDQWTLQDIRSPEPANNRTLAEWVGWQPREVVIQVFPYGQVEMGSLFVSTMRFPELTFNISADAVQAGISQSLLDQWGKAAEPWWGLEYVSMPSLSDSQMHNAFVAARNGAWGQ